MVADYHAELVARLRRLLGRELVGVYAAGSFALGDFDPIRSDLDVAAVVREGVADNVKADVADALRHDSLPCPARGLEFVLYPEAVVRAPTDEAGFELNLNTGREVPFRVDLAPGAVERHWFPIDRAILAERGIALCGPSAQELFAPLPRDLLLPVVRESLEWHLQRGVSGDDDAVLNACRALRYVVEGDWTSKGEAGAWALRHVEDAALVEAALHGRTRRAELGRERVERFLHAVLTVAEEEPTRET